MARITGGELRGRVVADEVNEAVRSTSERAREALFSIVGQDLSGERWLDAFGGTGVVGIEARSRGADVVIVEQDSRVRKAIEARISALKLDRVEVLGGDARAIVAGLGPFDVVFADPPWAEPIEGTLAALAPAASRIFVLEADAATEVPDHAGPLRRDRVRSYGRTAFHVFRPA